MKKILKRINSEAPVRICDIGGWTDTWFAGHGSVFNIGVNPCVEVRINVSSRNDTPPVTLFLRNYREKYSMDPKDIVYNKHPIIEAAIDSIEIPPEFSLEIEIFSKIPAGGSLGTSAAVCVALLGALDALTPERRTPHEIATLAHHVETEKLGLQSGVQDQLCSAYGGINFIQINPFPNSKVTPIQPSKGFLRELENRLSVLYIGIPHKSSDVHKKVIADLGAEPQNDIRIEKLRNLAEDAREAVVSENLETLGMVMNQNTQVQRELHPDLVCKKFNEIINIAEFFEALGCKVNGAGGDGGSVTILDNGDHDLKKKMLHTLEEKEYLSIPISLSSRGVHVWED